MTTMALPGCCLRAPTWAATSAITVVGGHGPEASVLDATYFGTALSIFAMSSAGSVTVGQ